ncbi:MAG: 4-hydroxy-tetrahydrodipicolinate synthase [Firmicutes bacterium]|nr:4-hydroxy-tetrahydrodipicolinate synthase [Bacillota bacterium]
MNTQKIKIFSGVCTALITPFKNGKVDYISFKNIIEHNIDGGVDALLFLGTTGEPSTLTKSEKQKVIKFALDSVANRVPVIIGVGGNNPMEIIALSLYAKKQLASAVLISSPYYNKATQNGIVQFYEHIANRITIPIIAYNVPTRTGVNIEPNTIEKLCNNQYIVGVKEASGNMSQICEVAVICDKSGVALYSGDDALTLSILAVGGSGVIGVASNVIPWLVKMKYSYFMNGKIRQAQVLQNKLLPFYKQLFCEVNPIPIKHILSFAKLCDEDLRLPLTKLEPKNASVLENIYKTL